MKRAEEQAYNDGRLAYASGRGFDACRRKNAVQRAAWHRGYEEERGIHLGLAVTAEQRAESERTKARLGAWAREFFGPKFEVVNRPTPPTPPTPPTKEGV